MFLITPKPRKTPVDGVPHRPEGTNIESATSTGPMRVANACGRCRLRKTKCNGEEPCSKCVRADAVCTFASRGEEGRGPPSSAYVSMLESQQRRLITAIHNMSELLEPKQGGEAANPSHRNSSRTFNLLDTLERYAPSSKNHIAWDETKQPDDHAHQADSRKRRRNSLTTSGDAATSTYLPSLDTMDTSYNGLNSDLGPDYPTSLDSMQDPTSGSAYNSQPTAIDGSLLDLGATSSYEKYSTMMRLIRQQGTLPGSPSFELQPIPLNPPSTSGYDADTNMSGGSSQPSVQANGQHDDLFSLIDWDASWQTFVDNYGANDAATFGSLDASQKQPRFRDKVC